jgi:hypothetical protein
MKQSPITSLSDKLLAKTNPWKKSDTKAELIAGLDDLGSLVSMIVDMRIEINALKAGQAAPQVQDSIQPIDRSHDNDVNTQGPTAPGLPGGVDSRHSPDPQTQALLDRNPDPTARLDQNFLVKHYDERGLMKWVRMNLEPASDGTPRLPFKITLIKDDAGNTIGFQGKRYAADDPELGSGGNSFTPRYNWGETSH